LLRVQFDENAPHLTDRNFKFEVDGIDSINIQQQFASGNLDHAILEQDLSFSALSRQKMFYALRCNL
jgi:hypothetical protein